MRASIGRDDGLFVPLILFVVLFALLPAALLLGSALSSGAGSSSIGHLLGDPVDRRAITNSLLEGGLSAGAALAVGYPVGVFLGRYGFPGRSVLLSVLLLPFLLPTVVVASALLTLFGSGGWVTALLPGTASLGAGLPAVIALNVVFNAPVVTLFTVIGVRSASRELEETVASLGGGEFRAYRGVWAVPSLIGASAGSLLTFLFSASAFAGPILVGGPQWYTVEARIWVLDQQLAEPAAAASLAIVAVALFAVPTLLYLVVAARLRAIRSRSSAASPRPISFRPLPLALGSVTALVVALGAALFGAVAIEALAPAAPGRPEGSALAELFGPTVSHRLGISTVSALGNTLEFALLASGVAMLLAITAQYALGRRPRGARAVGALAFAPLLISPVVLALALTEAWLGPVGGVGAVAILIVISQAILALPFTVQGLGVAFAGVPRSLSEAARSLGASPWQGFLDIDLPAARRGVAAAALFAFALGLGEFTATNFLSTPSTGTLTVEYFRLGQDRLAGLAPGVAGLLALVSALVFGLLFLAGGRRAELL